MSKDCDVMLCQKVCCVMCNAIVSGQGLSPVDMLNECDLLLFFETVRCLVPLIEVKAGYIS